MKETFDGLTGYVVTDLPTPFCPMMWVNFCQKHREKKE
jgi:hypothetical protein